MPGSGVPGMPTQFSRAMEELGIQMIFALSPQAKGRVERIAETFQGRLITELQLAGASSIGDANSVLEQFLPRFNRRFRVPTQHPEPAFPPPGPAAVSGTDSVLQTPRKSGQGQHGKIPDAYAAVAARAVVQVLKGLDVRLSVRHEGRMIASQEAPPSPLFPRNGHGPSASIPVPDLRCPRPGRTLNGGCQTAGLKG